MARFVINKSMLPAGPSGANGRDGINGRDGLPGASGRNGSDGKNGLDGRNGTDGLNGRDGVNGRDGSGLVWRGLWSADAFYGPQDVVQFNGSSYIAISANDGVKPPKSPWQLMAAKGESGGGGGGLAFALPKPGQIYIGDSKGQPAPVTMSGDATIDEHGVITVSGGGGGSGDVVGPASATDSDFAQFNTTTGKLLKDGGYSPSSFDAAGAATTAQSNAEAYADTGDTSTLASAKSYADTGDAATLASAKSYADTGDANTLASAKSYADTQDTTTLATAEAYTDAAVSAGMTQSRVLARQWIGL